MCRSREISGSAELLKALIFPGKKGKQVEESVAKSCPAAIRPRAAAAPAVRAPPGITLLFSQPDPSTLLLLISARDSLLQK